MVLARNNDVFNRDGADVAADIVSLGEHVLARADELPEALHARVLSAICLELFWVGEPERRRELSDRSLEVARRVGHRRLLADVLRGRSMIYDLEDLLVAVIAAQPGVPVWRMGLCGVYLQTDRHELARPHVEAVAADDFAMVPRNALFLLTCSSVARVASQVGALEAAELAYGHAAAFDHQLAWSGASYEYPIGVGVGAAAAALGRFDDAERHFAASLELCERAGAPSYHAATQIHWAEALAMRGAAGDGARAREMADAALATAEELGLAYVAKRARRLIQAS